MILIVVKDLSKYRDNKKTSSIKSTKEVNTYSLLFAQHPE